MICNFTMLVDLPEAVNNVIQLSKAATNVIRSVLHL